MPAMETLCSFMAWVICSALPLTSWALSSTTWFACAWSLPASESSEKAATMPPMSLMMALMRDTATAVFCIPLPISFPLRRIRLLMF